MLKRFTEIVLVGDGVLLLRIVNAFTFHVNKKNKNYNWQLREIESFTEGGIWERS
jgi:hypothetical protein